ncbi:Bud-site selection protein, BUD22 [Kalmanozyma brasiliensis GHG001]|uniref:Bud22 domain-containing protein n=1 Tax=Kalmanozyma brasiliensis (strain GHG001) TaxID=1365824 RepID=V5GNY7_KALBG|nr:Bud-site selection protein, BUD22 [Kalmanozyma brasiliensis GHG001]EST07672.1 Bud-site selection protein, BUD22 [Kalmanozyma brasiliensis GHG001]
MGSKARSRAKQPSPSLSASSASEASSSRSALEVEEVITADNSDEDQASNHGIDSDDDEDMDGNAATPDSDDDEDSARPTIDVVKARTKLHHVAKTLRATAKKSKTFELQKLVKKLKGLRKKASLAEQAKLAEKQLVALKVIDTALLAGRALVTKMVKAKLLPRPAEMEGADEEEWMYFQMVKEEDLLGEEVLRDPIVGDGDKAAEKAKAKITSSKVLADEVGRFVDELKKLAGIEPIFSKSKEELDVKGKGKAKQEMDEEEDEDEREWSGSEDESESDEDAPRRVPVDEDDEDDEEGEADEEELARIGRQKVKALGDLSLWDDLIGSDSAPESESEDEAPAKPKRKRTQDSDVSTDNASSDDDDSDASGSGSDDSESDSDASSSSSTSDRPRKKKSKSTFLPSLSSGFIPARSDDEYSDAEADLADDPSGKKERKNRMGQRARKALYEKKYGKNANHLKLKEKQKAAKLERATTRPPGAMGGRQRPPAFQAPKKVDGGWGGKVAPLPKQPRVAYVPRVQPVPVAVARETGGGSGPANKAPAATTVKSQEMHPSWIAKQKQKELMAQVKPQGKKVVFD